VSVITTLPLLSMYVPGRSNDLLAHCYLFLFISFLQRLGLDDMLFGKYYDRALLTIQTLKMRQLIAEKEAAIAKKQTARIKELTSAIKSVYVYKETDPIPEEEVNSYLTSLTNDFDARYRKLIEEECFDEAELCENTKNALL